MRHLGGIQHGFIEGIDLLSDIHHVVEVPVGPNHEVVRLASLLHSLFHQLSGGKDSKGNSQIVPNCDEAVVGAQGIAGGHCRTFD